MLEYNEGVVHFVSIDERGGIGVTLSPHRPLNRQNFGRKFPSQSDLSFLQLRAELHSKSSSFLYLNQNLIASSPPSPLLACPYLYTLSNPSTTAAFD